MKSKLPVILLLVVLTTGCEELFLGPQPKFYQQEDIGSSLNIFGVFRPDSIQGAPGSFVMVTGVYKAVNDTSTSMFIEDVHVIVQEIDMENPLTMLKEEDGLGQAVYKNNSFKPEQLKTYILTCYKDGYDTVTAQTTLPAKAVVLQTKKLGNEIILEIEKDPTIFLIDLYFYIADKTLYERVLPDKTGNTLVNLKSSVLPDSVDIFTYDKNLAEYYSSTNVFIKPNTYKIPVSTVQNGYGCLGSLNKTRIYP